MKYKLSILILFSLLILGCEKKSCREEDFKGDDKTEFELIRIDKEMFAASSEQDVISMFNKHSLFAKKFLQRNNNDAELSRSILAMAKEPNLQQMAKEADNTFGDFQFLKDDLGKAFARAKYYYPNFVAPKVYTIVSGFGNDVFVADSIVVLGIDCFIGEKAKYRPEFPDYILKNYRKEYMGAGVALMISNKYNETDFLDKSMLAEMIYWGKAYYFMEKLMPCTHDSIIIGYTNTQLTESKEHERVIWNHFLDQKLLFETDHFLVNKYVGERPNVTEIGNKCPGKIGRWLGWNIVRKYMEKNNQVTLQQLMAEKDAKKIFNLSGYKPE